VIVLEAQMNIAAVREIVDAVNDSNIEFEGLAYSIMEARRQNIIERLRKLDPPRSRKSAYPLRWTSEKQRRAFFATDGFGGGIPHRRKSPSQVQEGWRVEYIEGKFTGALIVSNEWDKAPYVIGTVWKPKWQQQFHIDLGWPKLTDINKIVSYELGQTSNALERAFLELAV